MNSPENVNPLGIANPSESLHPLPTANSPEWNPSKLVKIGKAEELAIGKCVCLVALGNMVYPARAVSCKLERSGIVAGLVSAVFVKPLDGEMMEKIAANYDLIVTLEDNVLAGGFGSAVLEFYNSLAIDTRVLRFGWGDKFVKHGTSTAILMEENGLSPDAIADEILRKVGKSQPVN
jgi:1-deoxy-D-xylulose-5-phosphate synthase